MITRNIIIFNRGHSIHFIIIKLNRCVTSKKVTIILFNHTVFDKSDTHVQSTPDIYFSSSINNLIQHIHIQYLETNILLLVALLVTPV